MRDRGHHGEQGQILDRTILRVCRNVPYVDARFVGASLGVVLWGVVWFTTFFITILYTTFMQVMFMLRAAGTTEHMDLEALVVVLITGYITWGYVYQGSKHPEEFIQRSLFCKRNILLFVLVLAQVGVYYLFYHDHLDSIHTCIAIAATNVGLMLLITALCLQYNLPQHDQRVENTTETHSPTGPVALKALLHNLSHIMQQIQMLGIYTTVSFAIYRGNPRLDFSLEVHSVNIDTHYETFVVVAAFMLYVCRTLFGGHDNLCDRYQLCFVVLFEYLK